jgi:hypothetical protein
VQKFGPLAYLSRHDMQVGTLTIYVYGLNLAFPFRHCCGGWRPLVAKRLTASVNHPKGYC